MTAEDVVAAAKDLPAVSPAALRLITLLNGLSVSNEEVVEAVKYDSVLTAKLLRACNSPCLGLRQPIAAVDQAVFMLGHREILRIVLMLSFGNNLAAPLPGYSVEAEELWLHSLTAGIAAELVASDGLSLPFQPPVAFTAGLLHDIGKLVIARSLSSELQSAIYDHIEQQQCSWAEAEQALLGTDHGEVGALLLRRWRLPEVIVEAVANHHQPVMLPVPRLSTVAHVANCLAHVCGLAPGWESYALGPHEQVASALGLDPQKIEVFVIGVREAVSQMDHLRTLV